jgi:hypothetical protein
MATGARPQWPAAQNSWGNGIQTHTISWYDDPATERRLHLPAAEAMETLNRTTSRPLCENEHLHKWVEKTAELTKPAAIHWVDGSQEEYDLLCQQMVASGTLTKLNQDLWPGCYYARSDADDVARVEDRTFICSLSKEDAGPTNNWENPFSMHKKLKALFSGEDARDAARAVLGLHAGPDDVRVALQHGPGRLAHVADRRAAHGFAVRRREYAHHGAHRPFGIQGNRQRRKARRALHPQRRPAAGPRTERRPVAMQQRKVHRSFP